MAVIIQTRLFARVCMQYGIVVKTTSFPAKLLSVTRISKFATVLSASLCQVRGIHQTVNLINRK